MRHLTYIQVSFTSLKFWREIFGKKKLDTNFKLVLSYKKIKRLNTAPDS
jgi:hypothetical protein